jgi:hypothetical protein
VNPAAYIGDVPLRLHVPEFRSASPQNPQVHEPKGMSIEAGFVRPAFHINYVRASKVRLISVQPGQFTRSAAWSARSVRTQPAHFLGRG